MDQRSHVCRAWIIIGMIVALDAMALRGAKAQADRAPRPDQRPVAIWPAGPLEVIAAFGKPVETGVANSLIGQNIAYFEPGKNAAGGDRPAGALRIVGATAADGGRTLILATDPHPRIARYVLPLGSPADSPSPRRGIDPGISYDLSGIEWGWSPAAADLAEEPRSRGWWPALDLESTRRLTLGSKPHEESLKSLAQPGRLVVSSLLKLPDGTLSVRVESSGAIDEAILGESEAEPARAPGPGALCRVELKAESKGEPLFFSFRVQTGQDGGSRPFVLRASYRMHAEKTDHVFARDQMIVPWAPLSAASAATATAPLLVPDLSGGDPVKGQSLFTGENARCSQCHIFRGQGGKIGPDLTEIGRKGRAEIYRNIAAPSDTIEPDYTSYTVATRDGQVVVGVVRAEGADAIRVTDTNAKTALIPRSQIGQLRPSGNSIMPVGLAATLGEQAMRDVIAYLTSEPPRQPPASKKR